MLHLDRGEPELALRRLDAADAIPLSRALATNTRASSILGVRPLRVKLIRPARTPEAKELYIRRSTNPPEALVVAAGVGATGVDAEA